MIGSGNVSGSGFEHVPGGERWKNASAYAYHYYCMSWLPGWETQPVYRKLLCDAGIAPQVFKAVGEDIRRIGGAQMMTEGLACSQANASQQVIPTPLHVLGRISPISPPFFPRCLRVFPVSTRRF